MILTVPDHRPPVMRQIPGYTNETRFLALVLADEVFHIVGTDSVVVLRGFQGDKTFTGQLEFVSGTTTYFPPNWK